MSENGKKDGIHVVGIEAETLHRLKFARVKLLPGGRVVRITGPNKSGKSSLLTVIKEAFGGASEVTEVPIHRGADEGLVRINLSNGFQVVRKFTEANPKGYLTVIAPDGGKHAQSKLNEWLGRGAFDPLAFFALDAKRQREILLGLGDDPELAAKLEALRAEHASLYAERTPHISEQQRCRRVKRPEGERPEPVDVSEAMAELRKLQAAERERGDIKRDARAIVDALRTTEKDIGTTLERIQELETALAGAVAQLELLRDDAEAHKKAHAELVAKLGETPRVDEQLAAVQARLEGADVVNQSLEPWREWDRAQAALAQASVAADALTEQINEKKAEELRLIAAAGIPVPGLTFHPETCEPLLNDFPLELASGGERIALAVAVAFATAPDLRICLIDEANDLDLEALQELDRLAGEHGFQVFACRVGLEGPGEIIVEDGEAVASEEPVGVA